MRILMCLGKTFPPDIRVEKEARALAQAGHNVFILSQCKEGSPVEENVGYGMVIRRIQRQTLWKRVWRFANVAFRGIDPLWHKCILNTISEYGIEAIHVHDLPLLNTGLKAARRSNIPVVADMHENYPEVVRFYHNTWRGEIADMLIPKRRWKSFEKSWLKRADRVITVVDEIGRHFIDDCGIPDDKVSIVMNVEDLDYFYSLPIKKDITQQYESYFVISYIGGFGRHRGIDTAISAMPKILSVIPNAYLILVGSGSNEEELKELVKKMDLGDAVEFTGWRPFSLVPSYISISQICLVPYIRSAQTNASAPHKLFQYMAMGKPVIVSSMESLSRIIEETGAGLVYPAESADSLAEAVIKLHDDSDLTGKLGEAGLAAVKQYYNWKMEGKKLISLYRGLCR